MSDFMRFAIEGACCFALAFTGLSFFAAAQLSSMISQHEEEGDE